MKAQETVREKTQAMKQCGLPGKSQGPSAAKEVVRSQKAEYTKEFGVYCVGITFQQGQWACFCLACKTF